MSRALDALDHRVTSLHAQAAAVRAAAAAPSSALQSSGWAGHRAEQLAHVLWERQQHAEALANEMERVAASLEALRTELAAALREVAGIEERVVGWFRRCEEPSLWQLWRWRPGSLPPSGSPEWRTVLHDLHRLGVSV